MGKVIKDKHVAYFVKKIETGELVFRNGHLVRAGKVGTEQVYRRAGRISGKGYVQLSGTVGKEKVWAMAHRVIWAFYNGIENLNVELQINHKNGIKDDNRIENLELVNQSQNMIHAYSTGLKKPALGETNPDSRLTERQVLMIKYLVQSGCFSERELGNQFGVTNVNIRHIKTGKTWSHIKPDSIKRVDTL